MRAVPGLVTLAESLKARRVVQAGGEGVDFTLHVQGRVGGGLAVTVRGDLDYLTAEQFLECIDRCLQPPPAAVHVDLQLVTFLDSSGIGALVTARKRTERAGTQLILERPTPAVYRTLTIAGLVDFLRLPRS